MSGLNLVDFRGGHLDEIVTMGGQEWLRRYFKIEDPRSYEGTGPAWSGMIGGEVAGCVGLYECNPYRAIAWAFFADWAGPHMWKGVKAVRDQLKITPYRRIEAYVDPDFENAVTFMRLLEFEPFGTEKPYWFPDGRAAQEYVKLKRD